MNRELLTDGLGVETREGGLVEGFDETIGRGANIWDWEVNRSKRPKL